LGRARFAELLAAQVSASPGGVVFGLTGPWGSGKTSVANMVVEVLEEEASEDRKPEEGAAREGHPETHVEMRPVILRFDPGLFSGTEQLVEHFFEELGAQFMETEDSRLQRIGELMADYGPMLGSLRFLPIIGGAIGGVGDLATQGGSLLQRRGDGQPTSVQKRRNELKEELANQPRPIVVIIDDLDRLRPQEVRDMMKLVRLNADFPKTTYLLCYDRKRVERALGATDVFSEEGPVVGEAALAEGQSYLEKIVQLSYEVPPLRGSDLERILAEGLTQRLGTIQEGSDTENAAVDLDEERLIGVFHSVVRPLMGSLRDVKRYLNVLPAALHQTRGEVALEDVVALEAVRLQLPEVHAHLYAAAQSLTKLPPPLGSSARTGIEEGYKEDVESLVGAGGGAAQEIVRSLIELLFPAAARHLGGLPGEASDPRRWRRDRRVAVREVLDTYLHSQLPEGTMPSAEVTRIVEAAGDRDRLSQLVSGMDAESLEEIVERIGDYTELLIDSASVGPVTEVLLSNIPRMREGSIGLLDFGAERKVFRLVKQLLSQISDQGERARIVEEALPHITNLRGKVELVEIAGYGEDSGDGLVSEAKARELDERALELVEGTSPDQLAAERKPTEILGAALRLDERLGLEEPRGRAYARSALDNDLVLLAVLKDCLGYQYHSGRGRFDTREEILQPHRLTTFIGENKAAERTREIAERVGAGELPLDPQSTEARALTMAVEHFGATPNEPGSTAEDANQ
jgi:hypothetical protein